ncbi:hypothetical protein NEOLEDRAFT_981480 [Neolentinus lepideus HHB14362 ss-1]|uniref:Structure-specific endonuclease subunit SLX4 n=1 Tax=Neolentinus lepideus HHB14362 ss-1 TaxID=1314782 RepID=A0A165N790_9AGAM|nr:hypothetical protein NEOLEDRAFT_981480 [Neolentinus lepideus HHB14362 ss-1]
MASTMHPRNVRHINTDVSLVLDIVEDSEPEREETRRKEKKSRKVKKQLKAQGTFTQESNESLITIPVHASGSQLQTAESSEVPNQTIFSTPQNTSILLKSVADISDDAIFSATPSVHVARPSIANSTLSSMDLKASLLGPAPSLPGSPREQEPKPSSQEPQPPDAISIFSSDAEHIESTNRLNIGRFSHVYCSKASKAMKLTPTMSRTTSEGSSDPGTKQSRTKPVHRFVSDFTDAELAKVVKCISCDLKWTVRKTALQKMLHIQTCARKYRLTDETVKRLIRRELDSGSEEGLSGHNALATENRRPETYLEDVLGQEAQKKKSRRPGVQGTVKSVTDTRNAIMDRARLLLGPSGTPTSGGGEASNNDGLSTDPQTQAPEQLPVEGSGAGAAVPRSIQAFSPPRLDEPQRHTLGLANEDDRSHQFPPPTQQFVPSRFANSGKRGSLFGADLDAFEEGPPATQSFGLSNLGSPGPTAAVLAERSNSPSDSGMYGEESAPITKMWPSVALDSMIPPSFGSVNEPVQTTSLEAHRRHKPVHVSPDLVETIDLSDVRDEGPSFYQGDYDGVVWENDGALLHFDPTWASNEDALLSPQSSMTGVVSTPGNKGRKAKTPPIRATVKNRRASPSQLVLSRTSKATRKRKSKVTAVQEDDVDENNLKEAIRSTIMQDKALHLRILRYEPIHYDVFVQLAADQGLPIKGLKLKLRKCDQLLRSGAWWKSFKTLNGISSEE